jgi:hypothetical protein
LLGKTQGEMMARRKSANTIEMTDISPGFKGLKVIYLSVIFQTIRWEKVKNETFLPNSEFLPLG